MNLSDFDYNLPADLIANRPVDKRDHSRLLVLDKFTGQIEHKLFFDIVDYLHPGDVLVLNDTKVIPARLMAKKKNSGGKVEILLHKPPFGSTRSEIPGGRLWECLLGGRNIKPGTELLLAGGLEATVIKQKENVWELEFNLPLEKMMSVVEMIGETPLPPYIKPKSDFSKSEIRNSYQTVYADDKKRGSVAAPTAGLHFTPELLSEIKKKGVIVKFITLQVGLGTFAPVKTERIEDHRMHSELAEVKAGVVRAIRKAKQSKNKIISVGTTSTRTLEYFSEAIGNSQSKIKNLSANVDLFIYPGYEFKVIDGLITNFHLPKSSLIMLVSALAGKDNIDRAYSLAIKEKYRFYSYGDAMLVK